MNQLEEKLFHKFLNEDEDIQYIVHKHIFALAFPIFKISLFGLLAPLLSIWLFPNQYMFYISLSWFLFGFGYFLIKFIDWYYDVLLLTDKNILDIEWKGIFKKSANRINYNTIESVSYDMKGILSTIFKCGDLKIETAGEEKKGLEKVANVIEVQKIILKKQEEVAEEDNNANTDVLVLKDALRRLLNEETKKIKEDLEKKYKHRQQKENDQLIILETKEIPIKIKD